MLGDSAVLGEGRGGSGGSGEAVAEGGGANDGAVVAVATSGGSNSRDDERGSRMDEGERSFGGNRWPRQETLALLRIRSDMDVAFRDATVKGPLWEEVSRKLAERGYHRSSKKCKEKFENVYKYHKRTKEGRCSKSDGKTYRFFDQLEALDHQNHPPTPQPQPSNPSKPPQTAPALPPVSSIVATTITATTATTTTTTVPMLMPQVANTILSRVPNVPVPSTTTTTTTLPMAMPQGNIVTTTPSINLTIPSYPTTTTTNTTNFSTPISIANPTTNTSTIPISFPNYLLSNSSASTSSTSSEETLEGRRKRKRKWKDFFERLMKEVIEKQEELQKRFLEAIEKREHDRMVREEAWRVQEMQRINREREILAQERSIAAAKDAAVMAFLQKITEQQNVGQPLNNTNISQQPQPQSQWQPQPQLQLQIQPVVRQSAPLAPAPAPVPPVQQRPALVVAEPGPPMQPVVVQALVPQQQVTNMEIVKADNNNGENMNVLPAASSSRWPKVEVEALIKLRTGLDPKYQENGPKGPLWEEISQSMRKLGYNRNSKRCKEKWENINKYFKKVKESNKKRPEDSKTCPYFHQLDALYRERNKLESHQVVKPESMVAPLMVRPEQQWRPPQQEVTMEDSENDPVDHHGGKDGEEEEEEDDDDDDDEGGGGGGRKYEIVASKPATASVGASGE